MVCAVADCGDSAGVLGEGGADGWGVAGGEQCEVLGVGGTNGLVVACGEQFEVVCAGVKPWPMALDAVDGYLGIYPPPPVVPHFPPFPLGFPCYFMPNLPISQFPNFHQFFVARAKKITYKRLPIFFESMEP